MSLVLFVFSREKHLLTNSSYHHMFLILGFLFFFSFFFVHKWTEVEKNEIKKWRKKVYSEKQQYFLFKHDRGKTSYSMEYSLIVDLRERFVVVFSSIDPFRLVVSFSADGIFIWFEEKSFLLHLSIVNSSGEMPIDRTSHLTVQKADPHKRRSVCHAFAHFLCSNVGLIFVVVAYSIGGAFLFILLEQYVELQNCQQGNCT